MRLSDPGSGGAGPVRIEDFPVAPAAGQTGPLSHPGLVFPGTGMALGRVAAGALMLESSDGSALMWEDLPVGGGSLRGGLCGLLGG